MWAHYHHFLIITPALVAAGVEAGAVPSPSCLTDRNVLFVSHNMVAGENLCSRRMELNKGSVVHLPGQPDRGEAPSVLISPFCSLKAAISLDLIVQKIA